jgi:F-type H+-transporting ATPase subunit b
VRAAESERLIAEIRANALESITTVAKDTTIEIVAALGGKADKRTVSASVLARMKEQA